MPRAIAPLVTITTSSPAPRRPAAASHTRPSTSARGSPVSSATMLEPSLTTTRRMAAEVRRLLRIELERDAADLELVARLEALDGQLAQHTEPREPRFDVQHRVLVVDVEALEQPRDPLAVDTERVRADTRDDEARTAARAVDPMLRQPGNPPRG